MLPGVSQEQRGAGPGAHGLHVDLFLLGAGAFGLVWAGLIFITLDNLRRGRKIRRQEGAL